VQLGEQRALRVQRLVAGPAGAGDDAVDDDLVAVGVEPGRVGAEDHRHPLLGQADPLEAEEVVVVQRDRLHLDRRPAVGRLGLGPVTDLQDGQRVLGRRRGDEGSEHPRNVSEPASCGDGG
jgi:hypothetical protein